MVHRSLFASSGGQALTNVYKIFTNCVQKYHQSVKNTCMQLLITVFQHMFEFKAS